MTFARCSMLVILGGVLAFASGCTLLLVGGAAAAGAGTVAYVKGELKSTEDAPFDAVWPAATAAADSLDLAVISTTHDAGAGSMVLRDAGDDKITIKVASIGDSLTQVRIRVGTFGDEAQSQQILARMRDHYDGSAVSGP